MTLAKLFKSGYEGVISEVGIGVPLQAAILAEPGASNFLLMGLTPYNQAFQPKNGGRSVSETMVVQMAQIAFNQAKTHGFPRSGKKLFSVAISGAHVNNHTSGAETHAWMCVMKANDIYLAHFVFNGGSRKTCIALMRSAGLDFLGRALVGDKPPSSGGWRYNIDVLRWPNMTLEDKLKLTEGNEGPVYFDARGNMQRPADLIRQAKAVYRGSFNPPTNSHIEIGGDALFEICRMNARKGSIDNADLAHRIRMLNLLGKGVLVTQSCSRFVQLAEQLERRGGKLDIEYIMGMDTFNRVCEDVTRNGHYNDLHKLRKMSLVVNERGGLIIAPLAKELSIRPIVRQNSYSSTLARKGDHSGINPVVSAYIHQNSLY
jgi:nicotinic acid mononucleotide adenylyltransferase